MPTKAAPRGAHMFTGKGSHVAVEITEPQTAIRKENQHTRDRKNTSALTALKTKSNWISRNTIQTQKLEQRGGKNVNKLKVLPVECARYVRCRCSWLAAFVCVICVCVCASCECDMGATSDKVTSAVTASHSIVSAAAKFYCIFIFNEYFHISVNDYNASI